MQGKRQNTGIEILRIVATLMICMCHLLYMGGLLAAVHPGTPLYSAVWVLECLVMWELIRIGILAESFVFGCRL